MAVQSPFLRRVIALDAVVCAASAVLLVLAAEPLAALTGLPAGLTRPIGAGLLVWAALLGGLASRPALPRAAVWAVIGLNALWVVESVMALVLGWLQPTAAGYGFVIAQAVAGAVIADLQFLGLKRAQATA